MIGLLQICVSPKPPASISQTSLRFCLLGSPTVPRHTPSGTNKSLRLPEASVRRVIVRCFSSARRVVWHPPDSLVFMLDSYADVVDTLRFHATCARHHGCWLAYVFSRAEDAVQCARPEGPQSTERACEVSVQSLIHGRRRSSRAPWFQDGPTDEALAHHWPEHSKSPRGDPSRAAAAGRPVGSALAETGLDGASAGASQRATGRVAAAVLSLGPVRGCCAFHSTFPSRLTPPPASGS